jgi:tetratricopeptide (TPR) repeat protein
MSRVLSCTVLASLLAWASSACNGERNHASDATGATSSQTDTPPKPKGPQPLANTFVSPSSEALDKLATALAGHLAAAEAASDPAARIAALEQAIQLDPFDPATLVEFGRTQSRANQPFEAMRWFELALRHAEGPEQRAEMLLELGVVTELLGNAGRAAELYNSSVIVSPTEAAKARLDALTHGVEVISHAACEWTRHGPVVPKLCPAYVKTRNASPDTCAYEHPPLEIDADTRVELFSHLDPTTNIEFYVLAVVLGGNWYSSPLTWVSHPPAEHADENVARLELRLERVAPEPKPQIVIEWDIERRAVHPATKVQEIRTTTNLGVLSVGSLEPRWWLGLRTASSRSTRQHGESGQVTRTQTGVEVKWLPKTGDFELLRTEHEPSAMLGKFVLGAYALLCPSEIDGS